MLQATSTDSSSSTATAASQRVAIQGYAGAFHEIAARRYFSEQDLTIVPAHTFADLVEMVAQTQEADTALMAIENTVAGSLNHNYALLRDNDLRVTGEVYLRIEQNLLSLPGVQIEELKEVHSHPMAIAQCRAFFRNHPHIHLVETADTALSAKELAHSQNREIGAIASQLAADLYGLHVLGRSIETNKKNHTRFLVLSPGRYNQDSNTQGNKVSLSFSVDHEVGHLYKVLGVLAAYQVNLTKIQSMPIVGKPWEYHFYLDFVTEGLLGWQEAIAAIKPITHDLRILGVYQAGKKD